MSLLEIYLCTVGASLSINEYCILKSNLSAYKNAKKNLKYRKLSESGKKANKEAKKEVSSNIGMMNLLGLGFALAPGNLIFSAIYAKNHKEFIEDLESSLNKKIENVNEIEENVRKDKKLELK